MADKLTLSQIITSVRSKLSDDQYSAAVITEAANDFQNQLFTDHRLRMAEAQDTQTINAGGTTADLPSDALNVINLSVSDSDNRFANIFKNYIPYSQFIEDHGNYLVANQARPTDWTDFGNEIRFAAPSNGSYAINIDYIREPELMAADSDESEITTTYREMMTLGTLARVMEVNEDYDISQIEREKLDTLITAFVRNEGRGMIKIGPNVMNTRRRRVRSEW